MPKLTIIAFAIIALIFSSCNDPLDKTYSNTTYIDDIKAIRENEKVSADDIELLTKYIAVSKLAGNDLNGKTYQQMLDKIKDIRKENSDKASQMDMQKEAQRQQMSAYLTVSLSEKNFTTQHNKNSFSYTILFKNISSEKIKMIAGSISLNDLLDREIKNIPVVVEEEVNPGETLKKIFNFDYNENDESDRKVKSKKLIDLRVQWNPLKIKFANGVSLE